MWAVYRCTTCGHLITAKGRPGEHAGNAFIEACYPAVWSPHSSLPVAAATYLLQARNTLANADASVLMSSAAIDAMLKDQKLRDGSLHKRIEEAVEQGILTKTMAAWAHRVRLDANQPRHADENVPHMTREDAERAFEFADALGTFLYVLPSKMPAAQE